jgi:hypothetical protein
LPKGNPRKAGTDVPAFLPDTQAMRAPDLV